MAYKTKQRELILHCLNENSAHHMTAEEITDILRQSGGTVGKTTVYRHLDRLYSEGLVRKYMAEEGESACYQLIHPACNEHFHMKCTSCGKLIHLECDHLNELAEHIFALHHFKIDSAKTVFYGECAACEKNGGKQA